VIAASDYSSSKIVVLKADSSLQEYKGVDLGQDPVLAVTNGRCFFVARDRDLLVELDPMCGSPIGKIYAGQSNENQNPQDVAATTDGTLFVPKFNTGDLVVLRPGGQQHVVPLSSFDPDGNPQPSSATTVMVNGVEKVLVTLERLDQKLQPGLLPSMAVRIDPVTLTVEAQMDLIGKDPFALAVPRGSLLYFAEPGSFGNAAEANAGVERIDPVTMTSVLVVREKDLGGSVAEVALTDGCAAAIVADPQDKVNATSLVTFDPETGVVHSTASTSVLRTLGYDLEGLAFIGNVLHVGDRRRAETGFPIHTFTVGKDCSLTARPDTLFSPQKPIAIRTPR
jgi:hypothetical protein